jgi:hypothetical protein
MLLLAPKARLTAAVAIRPRPSSSRADTAVLSTPAQHHTLNVLVGMTVPLLAFVLLR